MLYQPKPEALEDTPKPPGMNTERFFREGETF